MWNLATPDDVPVVSREVIDVLRDHVAPAVLALLDRDAMIEHLIEAKPFLACLLLPPGDPRAPAARAGLDAAIERNSRWLYGRPVREVLDEGYPYPWTHLLTEGP